MKFDTSVIELIKERRSKRTYVRKDLDTFQIEKIQVILQKYGEGPFGNKVQFSLIEKKLARENHKVKLGTYGFISGASYFIAGHVKSTATANTDYGYLLEKIILHLTEIGLGTCWLGGTFSRSEYADILNTAGDTIIPAITPVGIAAESPGRRESIIRWGAKADTRKPWDELFFNGTFLQLLTNEEAGAFEVPLEMVRLAPSASNKQPWRLIKTADGFHFYLKRTPGYGKISKGVDLQMIDIGIAMSHFELACAELNLEGHWSVIIPGIATDSGDEYCISWVIPANTSDN
jgi:hypothetical protein